MQIIKFLVILIVVISFVAGFSLYREVSREEFCHQKVLQLVKENPTIKWDQMAQAPSGFTLKTIPSSLKKEVECEREQKDFVLFLSTSILNREHL